MYFIFVYSKQLAYKDENSNYKDPFVQEKSIKAGDMRRCYHLLLAFYTYHLFNAFFMSQMKHVGIRLFDSRTGSEVKPKIENY